MVLTSEQVLAIAALAGPEMSISLCAGTLRRVQLGEGISLDKAVLAAKTAVKAIQEFDVHWDGDNYALIDGEVKRLKFIGESPLHVIDGRSYEEV